MFKQLLWGLFISPSARSTPCSECGHGPGSHDVVEASRKHFFGTDGSNYNKREHEHERYLKSGPVFGFLSNKCAICTCQPANSYGRYQDWNREEIHHSQRTCCKSKTETTPRSNRRLVSYFYDTVLFCICLSRAHFSYLQRV